MVNYTGPCGSGFSSGPPTKRLKTQDEDESQEFNVTEEVSMDSKITSENRAVTTHVWRDPDTEKELLCLTVGVPVMENVEFSLVGNGPSF